MALTIQQGKVAFYECDNEATDLLNGSPVAYASLTTPVGFGNNVLAFEGTGAYQGNLGFTDLVFSKDTGRMWKVCMDVSGNKVLVLMTQGSPASSMPPTAPPQYVITFGSTTVVAGTRTMDPGGLSRASSANAPSNANPGFAATFGGSSNRITVRRTNAAADTITVTLFVNNVATLLTYQLPSGQLKGSATLVTPVTWSANDTLAMQAVVPVTTSNNVVVAIQVT